jgi:subtilase family serine protease
MSIVKLLQVLRVPVVCAGLLFGLAISWAGTMAPLMRLRSLEPLATVSGMAAAPQYALRTCQVANFPGVNGSCYDPYQMRRAYQLEALIGQAFDGTGQTIVIVDAFQNPNLVAQIAFYNNYYGLPATNLTQIAPDGMVPFDPTDQNMVGWAEEISLDVEWAHAMAPGARIVLVLAKTNEDNDILSALKYAVDNNLGNIISMSFGDNESCVDPTIQLGYHDAFADATRKNITLFASSADEGAALQTCDGNSWVKAVSHPASDPLVTGVGGTELHAAKFCLPQFGCDPNANPLPGTYLSEITWNEGLPYGDFGNVFGFGTIATGGGFSIVFEEPPYQQATLPGGKQRAVPDVAFNAAVLHGVLTYLNFPGVATGFYRFGGTSAGAPQWAAITAIANQRAGHPLGFLNSAIYQIGKLKSTYPVAFHDTTSGTNSSLQFDASNNPVNIIGFDAGPGWDAATGFGSPIAPSMVDLLAQYVSPGDGNAAIATTKPKPNQKPVVPGKVHPH